jgi:hypothetical protein
MADLPGFAETPTAKFRRSLRTIGIALFPPRVVLFAALFAWYLYVIVDPRLIFQARSKLFLWNLHYFTDFIGQPGSLLEWADCLLMQLCCYGWPGAIALAAVMWLLLVSTIGLMNTLGRAAVGGTWVIPGVYLMALYSQYTAHTSLIVGLALAMTAANGWTRAPVRRLWLRLALFTAISAALYYVTGPVYYCFAACCVVYEAPAKKRWLSAALLLAAAVGVKFALDAVLDRLDLASRYYQARYIGSYKIALLDWQAILLYVYFPACALLTVFRQSLVNPMKRLLKRLLKSNEKPKPLEHDKGKKHKKAVGPQRVFTWTGVLGRLRWIGGTVFVLASAVIVGYCSLDPDIKAFLEINYCAEHKLWNELLRKVKKLPLGLYQSYANHDVNLALYHTGRMPYDMFSYPQVYWPLFSMEQIPTNALICKPCDLLLEVGRVNEAEHLALELLQIYPSGGTLKRLALVKMIKGQSAAAKVFLNVLRDDLVLGRWAEEYLQRLATDPDLAGDEDIRQIRRLMISEDDLHLINTIDSSGKFTVDYRAVLLNLLKKNCKNRMAFEYYMAINLLARDVKEAVESFTYLDNFAYPAIPSLYEEAALVHAMRNPKDIKTTGSGVYVRNRRISEASLNRYRRFQEIIAPYGGIDARSKSAVAAELGDSYFFYYFYGLKNQP